MARVAGVDLPPQKRAAIGLTYIYGIGRPRALTILTEAQVSVDKKIRDLSEDELTRIRSIIDQGSAVEGDLRKQVSMDIKRLMDIGCYRGIRHRQRIAGTRTTYEYQCANPQRSTSHDCGEEEGTW